jgi:hypothetical protein
LDRREILQALRPCFWCAGAPGPVVSRRIIKTLRRLDNLSAKQLDFKSPAMHKPGVSMQTALLFFAVFLSVRVLPASAAESGKYTPPRFPSYVKPSKTSEDIMPFARAAVRQTGGHTPLGLVEKP